MLLPLVLQQMFLFQFVRWGWERPLVLQGGREVVTSDKCPPPLLSMGSGHPGQWGKLCVWDQAVNLPFFFFLMPGDEWWLVEVNSETKLVLLQALQVL